MSSLSSHLPPSPEDADGSHFSSDQDGTRSVVKVLQRASECTVFAYSPSTSSLRRWNLSAGFFYRVLQFMRFRELPLLAPDSDSHAQCVAAAESPRNDPIGLNKLLTESPLTTRAAVRALVGYLMRFGLQPPAYENMADVVAERTRTLLELEALRKQHQRARDEERVVSVQTQVRRLLARKLRVRLALVRTYMCGFFETVWRKRTMRR